jgi:hypothetical protein
MTTQAIGSAHATIELFSGRDLLKGRKVHHSINLF